LLDNQELFPLLTGFIFTAVSKRIGSREPKEVKERKMFCGLLFDQLSRIVQLENYKTLTNDQSNCIKSILLAEIQIFTEISKRIYDIDENELSYYFREFLKIFKRVIHTSLV